MPTHNLRMFSSILLEPIWREQAKAEMNVVCMLKRLSNQFDKLPTKNLSKKKG